MTNRDDLAAQAARKRATERILQGMYRAIEREIVPALHTPDGITTAHLLLRLINYVRGLDDTTPSIGAGTGPDPSLLPQLQKFSGLDLADLDFERLGLTLSKLIVDPNPDARDFMRALSRTETQSLRERDPEAAGSSADLYLGGRTRANQQMEKLDVTVDSATLTAYLYQRFPKRENLRAENVETLSGGFSKQTIRFDLVDANGAEGLVIRKDLPVNPTESSATDEFPLLQAAWEAKLPVPEPLWCEPDPAPLGTPFIVVRHVRGTTDVAAWRSDSSAQRRFAESLADVLVRLQSMSLECLGTHGSRAGTLREQVSAQLDNYRSRVHRWMPLRRPLLDAAFAWLKANIPDSGSPPALVHGDIGFHNLLMEKGNVNALLDWEFAHCGDPLEDLFYCKAFVEQVIDWETFMQVYIARGGADYDRSQTGSIERYYEIWRNVRNASVCARPMHVFLSDERAALKSAVAGLTFLPRFELEAFNMIVER